MVSRIIAAIGDVFFFLRSAHWAVSFAVFFMLSLSAAAGLFYSGALQADPPPEPVSRQGFDTAPEEETPLSPDAAAGTHESFFQSDAPIYIGGADGDGCATIGEWDAAGLTCSMTRDAVSDMGIVISGDGVTLEGNAHRLIGGYDFAAQLAGVRFSGEAQAGRNVTIRNLEVEGYWRGISLQNATALTISGNSLSANDTGIHLDRVSGSIIDANYVTGSQGAGISLDRSSNNQIRGNAVSESTGYGLLLKEGSDNNTVYQNSFLANGIHAGAPDGGGNSFHQPLPRGGNYWSGESAPDADGNGVMESPSIFAGGEDALPWTAPEGWLGYSSARYVTQHMPTHMVLGTEATLSVTLSNNGNTTWSAADGYYLANIAPGSAGPDRVELDYTDSVAPGMEKTFEFPVTALAEGAAVSHWRMATDGAGLFGEPSGRREIAVSADTGGDQRDSFAINALCDAAHPGEWSFYGGVLVSAAAPGPLGSATASFGLADIPGRPAPQGFIPGTDQTVEMSITATSPSGAAGFQFRRPDGLAGEMRHFAILLEPGGVVLHRMNGSSRMDTGNASDSSGDNDRLVFNRQTNRPYRVKMMQAGQNIRVYIDEEPVPYIDDTRPENLLYSGLGEGRGGRVALRCIDTACAFDGMRAFSLGSGGDGASWYLDGQGRYAVDDAAAATAVTSGISGPVQGANQRVGMKIAAASPSGSAGFHFRRATGEEGDGQHFGVFLESGQVLLHRMHAGTELNTSNLSDTSAANDHLIFSRDQDRVYRVKMFQNGQNIKVFIDDEPVPYIDDTRPENLTYDGIDWSGGGDLALRCIEASCRFADVGASSARTPNESSFDFHVTDNGFGTVTFSVDWKDRSDSDLDALAVIKYRLYPGYIFNGGQPDYTEEVLAHAGGQSATVDGLLPGRYYDFEVTMTDPDGVTGDVTRTISGVLLKDNRFSLQRLDDNPFAGKRYDEVMMRAVHQGEIYWGSNQGQWSLGNAFEYKYVGADRFTYGAEAGRTLWNSYPDPATNLIYVVGEARREGLGAPQSDDHYRAVAGFIAPGAGPGITIFRIPGTDDINELIALGSDGTYLYAGERGPGTGLTDSAWPRGRGLWKIPIATIHDPGTYQRVFELGGGQGMGPDYQQIVVFGGRLYLRLYNRMLVSAALADVAPGMRDEQWTRELVQDVFNIGVSQDGARLHAITGQGDYSTIYTHNGAGWNTGVESRAFVPEALMLPMSDGRLALIQYDNLGFRLAVADPATGAAELNVHTDNPGIWTQNRSGLFCAPGQAGGANATFFRDGDDFYFGTHSPGKLYRLSFTPR